MVDENIIFQVMDYASTTFILLGIWGSVRDRRMWWIYCVGCGCLAVVAAREGLIGVAIGGVVSVGLGIRNALYKKEPVDD